MRPCRCQKQTLIQSPEQIRCSEFICCMCTLCAFPNLSAHWPTIMKLYGSSTWSRKATSFANYLTNVFVSILSRGCLLITHDPSVKYFSSINTHHNRCNFHFFPPELNLPPSHYRMQTTLVRHESKLPLRAIITDFL